MDTKYMYEIGQINQEIIQESRKLEGLDQQMKVYEAQLFHKQLSANRDLSEIERLKELLRNTKMEKLIAKAKVLGLQRRRREIQNQNSSGPKIGGR